MGQAVYSRVVKLRLGHQLLLTYPVNGIPTRLWTWEVVQLDSSFIQPLIVESLTLNQRSYIVSIPDSDPIAIIEMMPQLLSSRLNARMHRKAHVRRHEESPAPLGNRLFGYESEATPIRNMAPADGETRKRPNRHLIQAQDHDRQEMNRKRRLRAFERRKRAEAELRRPSRLPVVSGTVPQRPPNPQHYNCPEVPGRAFIRTRPTNALDWCEKFDRGMLRKAPVHCEQCKEEFFGLELVGNACQFCRKVCPTGCMIQLNWMMVLAA